MAQEKPSFLRRIPLAFWTFFAVLANGDLAAQIQSLRKGRRMAEERPQAVRPAAPPPPLKAAPHEGALQLLGLLQREARFIDFTEEDIGAFADADVGAAARVVHEGCRKVLREHFTIRPVRDEREGSRVTLGDGFDAAAIRLTGRVVGDPPFTGSVSHRGWRVTETRLPKLAPNHDPAVVAPAEVEL